ncbi:MULTISPECIES: flagellar protein FliT [Halomonadaceae]|uniref:flagellar protein FliT n=1 Tax=Halomonadaceae TaxID=28256 RepID=UPI00159A90EE|nr:MULTISPECIES: flagellar protein FliT [Halomonas]QJQ96557.1 flagellar protein FliT [Halomonas sp. PA5]
MTMTNNVKTPSFVKAQELLLRGYESLNERSVRILELARQEDWVAVVQEESLYLIDVERLNRMESGLVLDDDGRERKAALLEHILERDCEVRKRLIARREELGKLMGISNGGSAGQVIEASQAFGQGGPQGNSPAGKL